MWQRRRKVDTLTVTQMLCTTGQTASHRCRRCDRSPRATCVTVNRPATAVTEDTIFLRSASTVDNNAMKTYLCGIVVHGRRVGDVGGGGGGGP